MDRLLFGDNQFFGVNHMSEQKAREQAMRFQDLSAIISVLDSAYDNGVKTFMCTTHERIADVCEHMRAAPERYADYQFYPCMPYAHKYANAVTEKGMIGALGGFIPKEGALAGVLRSGVALAQRDVESLAKTLVDLEMQMFKGLKTPVVFLQNVVVDLLLGMGMHSAFRVFHDYVRERYDAEAGFITMNLPMLLDALDDVGVENPIVCANINKIGFRTCGGLDAYMEALQTRKFRAIAMSVFASGAIEPREAISWIAEQPNIQSIVFGASSARNIESTCSLVREYYP